MTWGPWAYNDSSAYISAARNIASGKGPVILHTTGKVKLVTEFPPFYPFLLSLFGGSQGDYVLIVTWINTILYSSAVFLLFLILHKLTDHLLFALIGTLIFASFFPVVEIFTGMMSEPLFLVVLFLDLLCLANYFKAANRRFWLVFLILFSAVLPIIRYAGILFIGVFAISILILDHSINKKVRVTHSLLFLGLSSLPTAFWAIRLLRDFGKFAGKSFSFSLGFIRSLIESLLIVLNVANKWIPYTSQYPDTILNSLLSIIAALIAICTMLYPFVILFFNDRVQVRKLNPIAMSVNLAVIGYLGMITFMHTTSSPQIDIINRTLLPLFPLLLIALIYFISTIVENHPQKKYLTILTAMVAVVVIRYHLLISIPYLQDLSENGKGYTARSLVQSGIIPAVDEIPDESILISNLSGFILFHTNRYPIFIENFPHYTFGDGDTYGEKEFREQAAALILLKTEFSNFYGDTADALYNKVTTSLNVSFEDDEGAIYYYD